MAIEAISKPAVTYQGGSSAPEVTNVTAAPEIVKADASPEKSSSQTDSVTIGGEESTAGMPANETIKKAVEEINKKAQNSEAIFGVHDATNRITIKIVDKDSKEVIKEFPPEKTLDMIAKVWEMAGILVDEKR